STGPRRRQEMAGREQGHVPDPKASAGKDASAVMYFARPRLRFGLVRVKIALFPFDDFPPSCYDDLLHARRERSGCATQIAHKSQAVSTGGLCVAIVQVKDLIEAGVHFGHRASRWNPKMRPYIYGKRNLIHIIDLRETVRGLLRGHRYLAKVASQGSLVLFVGTKRQAKEAVEREAARSGMPFVSERWLGGTLTNYRTIRDRLKRLQELEGLWLPAGENPAKYNMNDYINAMLNEAGKLELSKAPES